MEAFYLSQEFIYIGRVTAGDCNALLLLAPVRMSGSHHFVFVRFLLCFLVIRLLSYNKTLNENCCVY